MDVGDASVLGVRLSWASLSDRGLRRMRNEDAILTAPGMLAVADGMGGHAGGGIASGLVVDRLRDVAQLNPAERAAALPGALQGAHDAIRAFAGEGIAGSTVTGLMLSLFGGSPRWLVWNVGDSRTYRITAQGSIHQITRDHSIVAELVAAGAITPEAAHHHPDRHVITRAIGIAGSLPADTWLLDPVPGERYLLCSDGLTNEVAEPDLAAIVSAAPDAGRAVDGLVALALERGGRDNVSAIVVFCEDARVAS